MCDSGTRSQRAGWAKPCRYTETSLIGDVVESARRNDTGSSRYFTTDPPQRPMGPQIHAHQDQQKRTPEDLSCRALSTARIRLGALSTDFARGGTTGPEIRSVSM